MNSGKWIVCLGIVSTRKKSLFYLPNPKSELKSFPLFIILFPAQKTSKRLNVKLTHPRLKPTPLLRGVRLMDGRGKRLHYLLYPMPKGDNEINKDKRRKVKSK